ncbi:MAG: hypothetical protein V1659_02985 [Candidatus Woesearchaeota archaeon]
MGKTRFMTICALVGALGLSACSNKDIEAKAQTYVDTFAEEAESSEDSLNACVDRSRTLADAEEQVIAYMQRRADYWSARKKEAEAQGDLAGGALYNGMARAYRQRANPQYFRRLVRNSRR